MKSSIVLRTFDDLPFHKTIRKVRVAMRAQTIGRMQAAFIITRQSIGSSPMVKANNILPFQIRCRTNLKPALLVRRGI